MHQQREALCAGERDPHRKELLDEAGTVWEPGEGAWENKLAALRSCHRATGHLAPTGHGLGRGRGDGPRRAHLANLRRKDGLGEDRNVPGRAEHLEAIDADWNCRRPLHWQRHHRILTDLVDADGVLLAIEPGVLFDGDDLASGSPGCKRQAPGHN